ncbi:hypothetical protein B0I37DRAFT_405030 [Chaetomium sp. MPI-CAGE-AT-0009]|nr:hypothetical protein B0I37DRAFT_405030 [Chaetomium sp. MPI-CAGE-AT-0009]
MCDPPAQDIRIAPFGLEHGPSPSVGWPEAFEQQSDTTKWYNCADSGSSAGRLQTAYETAKAYFGENLGKDGWLDECNSIEDVRKVLSVAKRQYELKPKSKAFSWLTRFSQRVRYYSTVLDVLAQHHPEYVSLVWGAFKLVFGAVVNHEDQIKQLAKTCTQIADLLPRAEITLKFLYINIVEFLRHAVKWYKQGKLRHTWTAIKRPWELGFRDYVEDINLSSRRLEQLASISSQAELRATHLETSRIREELSETRRQLDKLFQITYQIHSLQNQRQVDFTSSRAAIGRIELNQLLSSPLLAHLPTSGDSMNYCRTLRNRRQERFKLPAPSISQLQQWSRAKGCPFVFTRCNNGQASKDFLVSLIDVVQEAKLPIIWALRFENYWDTRLTYRDLLKMLVVHSLQTRPDALTTGAFPVTAGSFREAVDEKDWLSILSRVLDGLPVVYIALDTDVLRHAMQHNAFAITKLLELVPRIINTTVKVIVAETAVDNNYLRNNWSKSDWVQVQLDGMGGKRKGGLSRSVTHQRLKRRRR